VYVKGFIYATVIKPERWGSRLKAYRVKKPLSEEIVKIFPVSGGIV